MPTILLNMRGDGRVADASEHLQQGKLIVLPHDTIITFTTVDKGTEHGKPSITISMELPDGNMLLVQTTVALVLQAANLLRIRYGERDAFQN